MEYNWAWNAGKIPENNFNTETSFSFSMQRRKTQMQRYWMEEKLLFAMPLSCDSNCNFSKQVMERNPQSDISRALEAFAFRVHVCNVQSLYVTAFAFKGFASITSLHCTCLQSKINCHTLLEPLSANILWMNVFPVWQVNTTFLFFITCPSYELEENSIDWV